jgi:hypothetical protein
VRSAIRKRGASSSPLTSSFLDYRATAAQLVILRLRHGARAVQLTPPKVERVARLAQMIPCRLQPFVASHASSS